jgi:hypothetical protein
MVKNLLTVNFCLVAFSVAFLTACFGFSPTRVWQDAKRPTSFIEAVPGDRRDFCASILGAGTSLLLFHPIHFVAHAASSDDALLLFLFVPDAVEMTQLVTTDHANFRTVELLWDDRPTGSFPVAVDAIHNERMIRGTPAVSIEYKLPKTWDDTYTERGLKCCNHITVYQKTGSARAGALEKAARLEIPVARALDIGDRIAGSDGLKDVKRANLIRSRSVFKDHGQQYFEFDMTFAPNTCDSSAGACPYDDLFLISATVLNKRLFVCVIQCDESQWKRRESDLGRIRSSFKVTDLTR